MDHHYKTKKTATKAPAINDTGQGTSNSIPVNAAFTDSRPEYLIQKKLISDVTKKQNAFGQKKKPIQRWLLTDISKGAPKKAFDIVYLAAMQDKTLSEFINLSKGNPKFHLYFELLSAEGLDKIEKGGGAAAAATGIFSSVSTAVVEEIEYTSLDSIRTEEDVKKVRDNQSTIRIILNTDVIAKQSIGKLIQILAHELTIHAVEYLPLLKLLANEEHSDKDILSYIRKGFTLPEYNHDLKSGTGILTPALQHLNLPKNFTNGGYSRLKELLMPTLLKLGHDKDFVEREMMDYQSVVAKNKMFTKNLK